MTTHSTGSVHHLELARVCLRYLSYKNVYESADSGYNEKGRLFLKYAMESWHLHRNLSELDDLSLCRLATKFLDEETVNFRSWAINLELNSAAEPGNTLSEIKPSTPLYYVALLNLVPIMEELHKRRQVNLNFIGGKYGTALQVACAQGCNTAFESLMKWNADVKAEGEGEFGTALNAAAFHGRTSMAERLLNKGAILNLKGKIGRTPLCSAAYNGHLATVIFLLNQEADLTVADQYGWTPLSYAANHGHLEVVRLLLDRGADLTVANNQGMMPLHTAAHRGYVEILRLLLDLKICLASRTQMAFAEPGVDAEHGLYNSQTSSLVGRQQAEAIKILSTHDTTRFSSKFDEPYEIQFQKRFCRVQLL